MLELTTGASSSLVMVIGTGRTWSLDTALGSQYFQVMEDTVLLFPLWKRISPATGRRGDSEIEMSHLLSLLVNNAPPASNAAAVLLIIATSVLDLFKFFFCIRHWQSEGQYRAYCHGTSKLLNVTPLCLNVRTKCQMKSAGVVILMDMARHLSVWNLNNLTTNCPCTLVQLQ